MTTLATAEQLRTTPATLNGYVCFYRGKSVEVHAETTLKARDKAAALFKAKKAYEVTAMLAEKGGQQVTHNPAMLG